ncbi:actin-dependent regulator of chromatin subfamily A [Fragilaria crotonensis]|nr:actin-dependent regulator of chromatin subfamily A [Fragilaria crotonensis]
MVKEDRSGWVAVESEFSSKKKEEIAPARTAFQFFQKNVADEVKAELAGQKFDVGQFSRRMRERWAQAPGEEKEFYERLAANDLMRFNQESHLADVARMEQVEKLQKEREQVVIFENTDGKKSTRRGVKKLQRKQEKLSRKRIAKADSSDWNSDMDEEEEGSFSEHDDDSEDSDSPKRKSLHLPEKSVLPWWLCEKDEARKSRKGSSQEESSRYSRKAAAAKEGSRRTDDEAADEIDFEEEELETTYLLTQPTTLASEKCVHISLRVLIGCFASKTVADEMGLGKTLQSISVLVYMLEYKDVSGPHLIVVPKSTLSNWMNEIARWAPTLKAVKFHGNKEEREEITKTLMEPAQKDDNRTWNVCVTTYEVCNIDKHVLNKFAWNYLIIDEAHRLKNEASTFSTTIRSFETRYRLLLTGTPLQNNLHELWALLNFLVPDVFANAEQFDEWFNLDIDDADEKNKLIMQLHKILRPFMLRRLKADVEKNLPPKHETILFIGMSALQRNCTAISCCVTLMRCKGRAPLAAVQRY